MCQQWIGHQIEFINTHIKRHSHSSIDIRHFVCSFCAELILRFEKHWFWYLFRPHALYIFASHSPISGLCTILSANNIKWVKSKIEHPCGWSTHGNAMPKMMKYHCCPTWWWYFGANHILSAVRHWDWTWNFEFQVSSIAFGRFWCSSNQYSPFFSISREKPSSLAYFLWINMQHVKMQWKRASMEWHIED